jgi:transposase-like protein
MVKISESALCFRDEAAAYEMLESLYWPDGPQCPRCGGRDRITRVRGKTARIGLRRCLRCTKQFTVTVGTFFHASHIPLHLWLLAAFALVTNPLPVPVSSLDIHKSLGVNYRTALRMKRLLNEAIRRGIFGGWEPGRGRRTKGTLPSLGKRYLSPEELSARYKGRIPVKVFNKWRSLRRHGPGFAKFGGKILFPVEFVEAWERSDDFQQVASPRLIRRRTGQRRKEPIAPRNRQQRRP